MIIRKRTLPLWATIAPALLDCIGQLHGATPRETHTATLEMEFKASHITCRSYSSPVTTYKDAIYLVYADPDLDMVIKKKTPDGAIASTKIMSGMTNDTHNGPSLGIDRDGHIHVVGDMHNKPWKYWVSDKPEDISAFTKVEPGEARCIPGDGVTYPCFFNDNNGVLFLSYRHVLVWGHGGEPGTRAAAIARYDEATKTWTALGGTDYDPPHTTPAKTFFWNNTGSVNVRGAQMGSYQPYKPRIFFDRNNGMHVSLVVGDNESTNYGGRPKFRHVVYAFSPDGGETFQKTDGTPITSLPITLANADVVAGPEFAERIGGFSFTSSTVLTPDGRPIVMLPTETTTNHLSTWNPSDGWSAPRTISTAYRAQFVTDGNGVLTTVDKGLVRSFDGTETLQAYPEIKASGLNTPFDIPHLRRTNQIRFGNLTNDNVVQVWTVTFSGRASQSGSVP